MQAILTLPVVLSVLFHAYQQILQLKHETTVLCWINIQVNNVIQFGQLSMTLTQGQWPNAMIWLQIPRSHNPQKLLWSPNKLYSTSSRVAVNR